MVDLPLMQAKYRRPAARSGAASGRRRRPAAADRPGAGAGRPDRLGPPARRAADRNLPPGRSQPDRAERPPGQSRADARCWIALDKSGLSDFYAIKARRARGRRPPRAQADSSAFPSNWVARFWPPTSAVCQPTAAGLARVISIRCCRRPSTPICPTGFEHHGVSFALGDKVMQAGKRLRARGVQRRPRPGAAHRPRAGPGWRFEIDGRPLSCAVSELDALAPAYATTVHKAQGSEYPVIVLGLGRRRGRMLRRNLVYTAITRAERWCVLVVEGDSGGWAIAERPEPRRWSRLRELRASELHPRTRIQGRSTR